MSSISEYVGAFNTPSYARLASRVASTILRSRIARRVGARVMRQGFRSMSSWIRGARRPRMLSSGGSSFPRSSPASPFRSRPVARRTWRNLRSSRGFSSGRRRRLNSRQAGRRPFTRRSRRMRTRNRGRVNVGRALATGEQLPQTAFGKMRYMVGNVDLSFSKYMDTTGTHWETKQFCLMNANRPIAHVNGSPSGWNTVRSGMLWRLLYSSYMVLGAKMKIRLIPCMQIFSAVGTMQYNMVRESSGGVQQNVLSTGNQVVYWYLRRTVNTNPSIGYPVRDGTGATSEYINCPWVSLSDFLNDRSVTYKLDKRKWNIGVETEATTAGAAQTNRYRLNTDLSSRSGISFTQNYSFKKLHGRGRINDPDYSQFWMSFNDTTFNYSLDGFTYYTLGCVTFDRLSGIPYYYYPYPMNFMMNVTVDSYCAFRHPITTGEMSDDNVEEVRAAIATLRREPMLYAEDDLVAEIDADDEISDNEDINPDDPLNGPSGEEEGSAIVG